MKSVLIILVWFVCFVGSAQQKSLYTNEVPKKPTEYSENICMVNFEKSMYSLTFENQTPSFFKQLIIRFMNQKHRNYTALGSYTLKILTKKNKYYIVECEIPEKFILLN